MANKMSILEKCRIAPPPGSPLRQTLPLIHFDMIFLQLDLLQNLLFYKFPCSKTLFLETVVPILKHSLSLTLGHFLPMSGNIIFPLTPSASLVCQYEVGDAVSMTFAEYPNADFHHLTGNHPREADEFHNFSPELPEAIYSRDFIKIPVASVQVTLFPDQGLCIGFTSHHAVADGATVMSFLQALGYVIKHQGVDAQLLRLPERLTPFYDRSFIEDRNGLDAKLWNIVRMLKPTVSSAITLPTNKVRASFVVSEADMQKLKNIVRDKRPELLANVSSFSVVCAHLWACLAKTVAFVGEDVADDEPEYLSFGADCRGRLSPPLPASYFGNCVVVVMSVSTHGRLKGNHGFLDAAQTIGKGIQENVNNEKEILNCSDIKFLERRKWIGKRVTKVLGSPRFDGRGGGDAYFELSKVEPLHTDCDGWVSILKSKGANGVEITLSLPKAKMDAFATIFNEALEEKKNSTQPLHDDVKQTIPENTTFSKL